ncbi:MAG: hypothetical protein FWD26_10625 [Treponema sp.]|nr:hypothetical protein [Treponema sp.]
MKKAFKLFGTIALIAIIGFSMAACDLDLDDLNGVWQTSGGWRVTISGSTGIVNAFGSVGPLTQDAINKGYILIGSTDIRYITKTSDLTWSGQVKVVTYTNNPNVATGTDWINCTIVMSADRQTINVNYAVTAGAETQVFTRQ